MKSNFVSDKYEIRKIPEFQFKYYKCFGWETVGNATGEPEDYDYEYDTRRLLLSQANPGAPNGLQSIFKDNYEHKIKTDENGQNDRLRLINIRRNRKIAMSDSVSVPYDKYIIPSLHSAYINRKYFISQNPTLMTASQRSNYIQMRVYRAAQKDDDGDEFD